MERNTAITELHKDYYSNIEGPIGGDERFRWIAKTFFKGISGKKVLDVGCGEGSLLDILQRLGNEVSGIDISESGVVKTQAKSIRCELVDISNERFPYKDSEFDIVTCLETIEHVENPLRCLQEIKRVLKDNGTLIISIPSPKILHPYCYPGLFQLKYFKEFLSLNDFEISRIVGWGQAIMFNRLMRFLKGKGGAYKVIYDVLYFLSRKRNLVMRKKNITPLMYAFCINFQCVNRKRGSKTILEKIAVETTPIQ